MATTILFCKKQVIISSTEHYRTSVSHCGCNPITFMMASEHMLATPTSHDAMLNRVTQLRIFSPSDYASEPGINLAHMRPVFRRVPHEFAVRFPHLRELDCP
ncbi:hypothetical protein P280DRAFT_521308 [Massarina eburnea CBS 473.64]|uniref:Uncharacterized protein n=1 Tax=Massarina eburnea CBS 473.64 TaxID=1395130 RepID=A0A6A6RPI4_9PLEO|nr:hypothetical protein P280DRAFT_521308 [Massarina eburnea CBS 473.64]